MVRFGTLLLESHPPLRDGSQDDEMLQLVGECGGTGAAGLVARVGESLCAPSRGQRLGGERLYMVW